MTFLNNLRLAEDTPGAAVRARWSAIEVTPVGLANATLRLQTIAAQPSIADDCCQCNALGRCACSHRCAARGRDIPLQTLANDCRATSCPACFCWHRLVCNRLH